MEQYHIEQEQQLTDVARQVVQQLGTPHIVAFYGSMGAGKTTLIKHLCHQLGVLDQVSSPSFGLVNEYQGKHNLIYHFDFYRIQSLEEIFDIGYEDYFFSEEWCFVEWPEKMEHLLPEEGVTKVHLIVTGPESRVLQLEHSNF